MSKKKKVILWLIPVVIIGVLIYIGTINKNRNKHNKVKTAKVSTGNLEAYLSTSGKIRSKSLKEYFGVQGKVKSVNVEVGEKVKKGEVLIAYDVPDLNSAVRKAEIEYNNAVLQRKDLIAQRDDVKKKKSDIDNEIAKLEESNKLQNMKTIEELKSAKSKLQDISDEKVKQTENAVELAKLALNSAKENKNKSRSSIVCEKDGIVTALNVKVGAMDSGAQPVVVVQDITDLEVVMSLNKYDSSRVKLGQEALIISGGNKYKGKISSIDPVAKEEVSAVGKETSLGVYLDILDKSDNLKVGFDVDVDILVEKTQEALKVPTEAIKLDKKGNSFVYVVKDGKAEERKVKVGIQSDTQTEILSGLKEGEKVILNPNESIKNGVLVEEV
ncbi:efflux RND transporter periplasmic adaptor subunit [Haloimpatiens massiliensis]|uniref:efflux RND transporter periplasmic adaptor subunit n=1 Tax=Haloimpatiens massiliensis TaxID=1658110 RepID=UPI0015E14CAA|nr:efflux RND transporter periplasmic adaptor subunit [Haloimpatiens massiliensis]